MGAFSQIKDANNTWIILYVFSKLDKLKKMCVSSILHLFEYEMKAQFGQSDTFGNVVGICVFDFFLRTVIAFLLLVSMMVHGCWVGLKHWEIK